MKISEIISGHGRQFPSIEIVPPLKGVSSEELVESVRPFMEFRPPFINVTSHRDEYEFRPQSDGTYTKEVVRSRMSEIAVSSLLSEKFGVETVPHLICAGHSRSAVRQILKNLKYLGIENVMALRGDCLLGEKRFTPEPDGFSYASEMVAQIRDFEKGCGGGFCIGVGGYPEKHFEAPNIETDIENLRKKVEAGADFIITQMFFSNSVFYEFCDGCRKAGITVPIIPGLKPLSTFRQVELLPESFSIDIPQDLVCEMRKYSSSSESCYQIGQEWCSMQCGDLLAHGVPAVHFYTMGRPKNVVEILRKHF